MFSSIFGRNSRFYRAGVKSVVVLAALVCGLVSVPQAQADYWDVVVTSSGSQTIEGSPTASENGTKPFSQLQYFRVHTSSYSLVWGGSGVLVGNLGEANRILTISGNNSCSVRIKMHWRVEEGEDPPGLKPPANVTMKVASHTWAVTDVTHPSYFNPTLTSPKNGFSGDPYFFNNTYSNSRRDNALNTNNFDDGAPLQWHLLTQPVKADGTVEFNIGPIEGGATLSFIGYAGIVETRAYAEAKLDNRIPKITVSPNYTQPIRDEPGDIEINDYVTIGLDNDGIPENPIIRFFQGDKNFAFDGLKNGQVIALQNHKWSVSPQTFVPRELDGASPEARAEYEVAPPTRTKNFHWNLGTVADTDPASFPKSTTVNVSAIDPSDGAMLHGTAKINWHLTPAMRFRLEGSIEPILPPDHDPGDEPGAAEWEQIETIKETRRQLADSGIQVISVVMEGTMLVVDVMMPDVTDVALGVVKAARAVRLVGKLQDILNTIKANRLAQWRAKRAARGKSPIVGLESLSKVINKGRVGTKRPGAIYNEADEAVGTTVEMRRTTGGSPRCFVAGTLILTPDGFKPIEAISDKDRVLARDEVTGKTDVKRVLQTFKRQAEKTLVISLTNGEAIETTDEHPFYVEGVGFMPAGNLKTGTRITTHDGVAIVKGIERRNKSATVYNFEVDQYNTYFVGKSKLWVHNWCGLPSGGTPTGHSGLFIEKPNWWPGWQPGQTFTDLDDVQKIGDEYWVISDKTAVAENMSTPQKMADWIKKHIYDPDGDSDLDKYYNAIQHGTNVPEDLRQAFAQGKLNFGLSFKKGASITPEFEIAVKEALDNWEERVIKKEVAKQISIGLKFPWEL